MLARVHVQHELDQRALQARQAAAHDDEARSGDLRGRVEIEHAEAGAQIDVIAHFEVEHSRRAPCANLGIRGLVFTVGHIVRQEIRQPRLDRA